MLRMLLSSHFQHQHSQGKIIATGSWIFAKNTEYAAIRKDQRIGVARSGSHAWFCAPRRPEGALFQSASTHVRELFRARQYTAARGVHLPRDSLPHLRAEEQLGDAALFFDPAHPEDLVSAILTISQDQELRPRMVQKGAE